MAAHLPEPREVRLAIQRQLQEALPSKRDLLDAATPPRLKDLLPKPQEIRETVIKSIPTPTNTVQAVLTAVNPMERIRTIAEVVTPVAILIGAGVVAYAAVKK